MEPDNVPWWKRRGTVTAIVSLVILAIVGGVLVLVHQHSDRDRLTVGATRSGDYVISNEDLSKRYQIAVPGANISVNVEIGRTASKLNTSTYDSTKVKAPRDGLLVHLEWWSTVTVGKDTKYVGAHELPGSHGTQFDGGHSTSLSIRSKDRTVAVDRALVPTSGPAGDPDKSRDKVIAVPGDLSDLELVAKFQGRTQSVSLLSGRRVMGAFTTLYPRPAWTSNAVTIEENTWSADDSKLQSYCEALSGGMTRTPYLDSLGWAPAGHEWFLVDGAGYQVDTYAARWSDGDQSSYYTSSKKPTASITVNGKRPVKALGRSSVDTAYDTTKVTRDYVFSVEAGAAVTTDAVASLSLKRRADSDSHGPAHPTLQLHESRSYPAVIDPTVRGRR